MKKELLILLSTLLLGLGDAAAQLYRPRDSWPYAVEDFTAGNIRLQNASLMEHVAVNINVIDATLHYLQDKTIMQADMKTVFSAQVGEAVYVNVLGRMHEVVSENEDGAVLRLTVLDQDELSKTDIGYGISSATASHQKTSLEMMGLDGWGDIGLSGKSYTTAFEQRGSGQLLPLRSTLYLYVDGVRIAATKRDVLDARGIDPAAAKAFFKLNKIKWTHPESLLPVLSFIKQQWNKE